MPRGMKEPYDMKISRVLKGRSAEKGLEEIQDVLGTIHDIDITVKYLLTLRKKTVEPIIGAERAERDRLFSKFENDFL